MNPRGSRPPQQRSPRRAVHGVLLLDKPYALSSNDALQRAKRLLRAEKAGHTGTLDPLATGLLPLCFGAATKFSQVSLDADKRYVATLGLGMTTSSADVEGHPLRRRPVAVTREAIAAALAAHTGLLAQTPPMHSALKHEGKALYEYARAGVEIERQARQITIHAIEVLAWPSEAAMAASVAELAELSDSSLVPVPPAFPELVLDIRCSKGTYIRTLAETIGEMLGCGAHLTALRRSASGPLDLTRAISLDALEALPEGDRLSHLLPPDTLLADWPAIHLPAEEAGRFLSGLRRRVGHVDCAHLRVYGPPPEPPAAPGKPVLLGTGHVLAGELIAERLLSPPEIAQLLTAQRTQAAPVDPSDAAAVIKTQADTSDTPSFATSLSASAASL
jgi:tRNA pseudouridine55 synthase